MPKPLPLFLLCGIAQLASCGDSPQPTAPIAESQAAENQPSAQEPSVQEPIEVLVRADDHIVLIGNGLADRMQHHGWLESYLQCSFPDLHLVIRNHGYSGDRIDKRPRNKGFPSADEYLSLSGASLILAMFGFNESFDQDLEGFADQFVLWIHKTRQQNYSGQGAPRIVLCSPIAHENLHDPNLPDGRSNNVRLAAITETMKRVARETDTPFLDLFAASQRLYQSNAEALTINGIHLNALGNRLIGAEIARGLGGHPDAVAAADLDRVRAAVLDKNWYWFNRYRATDGNDVWGSRSTLSFTNGQTNGEVLRHELTQLDVMTANRDKVIWAAATGQVIAADDSNVPAPIEVISNLDKPQLQGGVSKTGSTDYLSAAESLQKLDLDEGLEANVFASEEMFPEMVNPVQLGVDTRGRLWVAAWKTYPKWQPLGEMDDRLLILPDEDRDGVADRAITFAKVHNPTGFEFWNGGVLVASAPDLLFLKDTDGDDVADIRIRVLGGLDSADTHHTANNFVYGPDGFLYYQRGVFNVSNVESPWSANQVSGTSGMYRFNPRTYEFSFHATNNPNPHGISFDYWGYHYATDGTGGRAYQVVSDGKGGFKMRKLLDHTVRPVPSSGILSSAHFPERFQGNFLICNSIAFLGMKQYRLEIDSEKGEAQGVEVADFLVSRDSNFRPTDFEIGDDGAMYVSDWANAIIGHMQHNVRDPNRDHAHGRIFRVTATGRPLSDHIDIDGHPVAELLDLLKNPVNGIRQRVRVELSERSSREVIPAVQEWIKQFDPADPADAHHLLEGLWVHQQFNVVNRELLATMLESPVADARVAARRVEQMWDHNAAQPVASSDLESVHQGTGGAKPDADAIVIRTVPEGMRYAVTEFTVKAGTPVKIWFENPDFMPHNFLIGQPGSAEEIGPAAEALGASGFAKGFIPDHPKVLIASRLLNYQEHQVLEFTAPTEPGDYDFLCTFPGHWRMMRGVMKVER